MLPQIGGRGLPPRPSATLAWDASPDATVIGYKLYSGIVGGPQTNVLDAGSALTLTVSNLQTDTTYFFFATAYNAEGIESEPSNLVRFSPSSGAGTQIDRAPVAEEVFAVAMDWLTDSLWLPATSTNKVWAEANSPPSASGSGKGGMTTSPMATANARTTASSPPGSYASTANGAVSANGVIESVAGRLCVIQASVKPTPSPTPGLGTSIQLEWTSAPGRHYQVLWKQTLNDPDWLPDSPIIPATASVTRWSHESTNASGFYQVALVSE